MELRVSKYLKITTLCCLSTLALSIDAQAQINYAQLKKLANPKNDEPRPFMPKSFYTYDRIKQHPGHKASAIYPLLPQWTPADLPLFCKIEYHLDKILPVSFRFRLGSLDYVNQLEQKPGY